MPKYKNWSKAESASSRENLPAWEFDNPVNINGERVNVFAQVQSGAGYYIPELVIPSMPDINPTIGARGNLTNSVDYPESKTDAEDAVRDYVKKHDSELDIIKSLDQVR